MIEKITENKKKYLDLLLLADESEIMIDKYLERGEMFIRTGDNDVRSIAVVTDEGNGNCEIKNIATAPIYQRMGYGKEMIAYLMEHYADKYAKMLVGTGDSPMTINFYEGCGFRKSHIIKNFFIDNYEHEMFEDGKKLIDMIYLSKDLRG